MKEIFKFRGDVYECDSETKKAHPGDVVHVRIAGEGFVVGAVEANGFEEENFFVKNENGEEFHVWVASGDRYTVLKPAITDKGDNVNHPAHYRQGRFETIEIIEDVTKDMEGVEAVCVANILKYVSRYKYKNGKEDLKKAGWYLNYLIERM